MEIRNQIRKVKVNEVLVPLLCVAGILYSGFTFFWEMSGRSSAQGEQVGSISYRYRVAQRRNANRVVWEDVEQQDRVFNRDSVRTDEKSEATVLLRNGARLELDPRSMIVLNYVDGEVQIQVESGSVLLRDAKNRMRMSGPAAFGPGFVEPRADTRLTVEGDSARIAGDFDIILNGNRSRARSILLNESGIKEVRREDRAQSPEDNARFFAETPETSIAFQWQAPPESIEISEDRFFAGALLTLPGKGQASREFPEGIYYWRVQSAPLADVRKFRVIRLPVVQLLRPGPGEVFSVSSSPFAVFAWTQSRLAQSYNLQISRSRDFSDQVIEKNLQRTGLSLSLPAGSYYWRVEARGALEGSSRTSETASFTIMDDRKSGEEQSSGKSRSEEKPSDSQAPDLKTDESKPQSDATKPDNVKPDRSAPVPLYPAAGQVVDMSQAEQIIFSWRPSPGASAYRLDLLRGAQTIYSLQTTEPRAILSDLSVLDVGDFAWRVSARYQDGAEQVSSVTPFRIFLAVQPDKPTLKP